MNFANTDRRFGAVTKTLHWLTALMILIVIPLGLIANRMAQEAFAPGTTEDLLNRSLLLFSLHKTVGVAIFLLSLARISWAFLQPAPGPLPETPRIQMLAARTIHWLLYGSLLLVPLTGWLHHSAATGFAPILWPFGQSLPFVPPSEALASVFAGLHIVLQRVLVLAILLHVAGAFLHHFAYRDATLLRMWPGRSEIPVPVARGRSALPGALALAIWAIAVAVGAGLGMYATERPGESSGVPLATETSGWTVTDGTLAITIEQLGSPVAGRFDDWTASIFFEERDSIGIAGHVDVTVSIRSLALGSVSSQATGPDFLDGIDFPVAHFRSDISRTTEGYVLSGPLTIRGISVPVSMPFDLTLAGDTATVSGAVIVDRLMHGIGTTVTDPKTLGRYVQVKVDLTAERVPPSGNP
ncbi:cytochrome b/b6 domain-containing protein [Sedimentitalea sp. JM2-8]|uniref:Cytochrome b/b6 domain-containing protein n=1 Tax=Sedimentitalea xiamensis TaxID=3050037 RepID=A0ABT7FCT7_9RHOB|nr:cytochrome b/b6 domain-containing protein [Sedimentitalea xiamensis]MDK3072931.1 cytochrome b/b6 domain-containing protein [Sedimentitalea xiamensis]